MSRRLSSTKRRNPHHPLNPRLAVVYFDLHTEEYNIEEDAREGDAEAKALLNDPRQILRLEHKALAELSRKFGHRISDEGHDRYGDLVCKFGVNDWAEVKAANDVISKHHIGGDDEMDAGAPYMVARGFRLYPNGVNDVFYGEESGAEGTWEEWLQGHAPAATARKARRNPEYRLQSTAWFYAPGFIQWVRVHENVEARRKMLLAQFRELSPAAAEKLLAGDFKVEGEDVIVDA